LLNFFLKGIWIRQVSNTGFLWQSSLVSFYHINRL